MSKHVFIVAVELTAEDNNTTKNTLDQIAERITTNLTDEFGITEYDNGKPQGLMGYEGPFITKVEVAL